MHIKNRKTMELLCLIAVMAIVASCAGDGSTLDTSGNPLGASKTDNGETTGPFPATLTAIQDSVFTPFCSTPGCHIGATAPLSLALDRGNAFKNLVGVQSVGVSSLLRVNPGKPDNSYLVTKLEGGPGMIGGKMPLGRPPLSQDQIDVIRRWIGEGAEDN